MVVFDDEHLAYWERSKKQALANLAHDKRICVMYANFKAQRDGILDSGFLRFYGTAEMHESGPIHRKIFDLLLPREQTHVGADTGLGVLVKIDRSADIRGLDSAATPYVVVASQGIWDEEAVGLALTRESAYVGLVASPTRSAVVREWLREETTVGDERIAALRAPAGLDIGAETAEEVALSILAELVQVRRGRADFVASPGPATVAGGLPESITLEPVVDDIVLTDPVCGMTVDAAHARHLAEHDGIVYAFCSIGCRTRFIKEPATFLSATEYSPMQD